MKRLISFVLCVVTVTLFVTGCSNNNNQKLNLETCYNCGEQYISNSNFCSKCGADLESHRIDNENGSNTNIHVDYSNYGFINNYGMTEWLEIIEYNFDDPQNAYVVTPFQPFIVNFDSDYLQLRLFEEGFRYTGDYSAGRLYGDPSAWQVVDNKILKLDGANDLLYSEELLEIQKIEIHSEIPLVYTEEDRFPMVIPTYFLDVSRDTTSNRYYIKSEYLK